MDWLTKGIGLLYFHHQHPGLSLSHVVIYSTPVISMDSFHDSFLFGSYCKDLATVISQGEIKDQGSHGGKIILPPPASGVVSSSLSRDFMGRTPISTVVNTFHQQETPALSDVCSFILVSVTIPESSSS